MTDRDVPKGKTAPIQVYVTNVNMPFKAMVGLVVKFWLATLAAGLLVFIVVFVLFSGILFGGGR